MKLQDGTKGNTWQYNIWSKYYHSDFCFVAKSWTLESQLWLCIVSCLLMEQQQLFVQCISNGSHAQIQSRFCVLFIVILFVRNSSNNNNLMRLKPDQDDDDSGDLDSAQPVASDGFCWVSSRANWGAIAREWFCLLTSCDTRRVEPWQQSADCDAVDADIYICHC